MNTKKLNRQRRWRHGCKVRRHVDALKLLISDPVVSIPVKKQNELLDYLENELGEVL